MFGPILEGSGINISNHDIPMEDAPIDEIALDDVINDESAPRRKMNDLSYELVASKFGMPILEAAKELQVSHTTLTLWCQISKIPRWPYRKIRSIDVLVTNLKEFGMGRRFGDIEVQETIKTLEEEKEAIQKKPSLLLKKKTSVLIKKMHYMISKMEREMKNKD